MLKTLLQIALRIRRFYWWLMKPTTRGVRALVVNEEGRVLLVRHKYGEGWFLPGGKVRRNERDEEGLAREIREELGITDVSAAQRFGEYTNTYEHKKDTIIVFVVRSFKMEEKRHFEIEDWDFFDPRGLPENVSPGTRRRIDEWLGHATINSNW